MPFKRDYRFEETEGVLQVRSDRRDHRPFGLYGGSPGGPSENYLNPATEMRVLPGKVTMTIKKGDVFRHVLAGAGGWGDPLERDPQAVLRDVRNELLSSAKAAADYGVIVDTTRWVVDEAATRQARAEIVRRRGWRTSAEGSASRSAPRRRRRRSESMATYRVGVDIGGTFTDIVLLGSDGTIHTQKISSSVDNYARAIVEGLIEVFRDTGISAGAIDEIRHGTTVASNAILERKGARVGLITTQGFRDVLEIRTLRMPRLYDMTWTKPEPLVERYLRRTVAERIDHKGRVEQALDRGDAERAGGSASGREGGGDCRVPDQLVRQSGARAAIRDIIKRKAPDLPLSVSCEVLPEIKEYERTSTTVINAYVIPIVATYLHAMRKGLDAAGITSRLLLMQSNGGLTTDTAAIERPMNIIEFGSRRRRGRRPGARAAKKLDKIITFDMGGTTAKASMVENGVGDARAGVRRRRRHHDRLAAADGGRLYAEGSRDRPRGSRRRGWLADLDRRRR